MSPDRITAGELRAMGYPIPDSIPDCGHTSRAGMRTVPVRSVAAENIGQVTNGELVIDLETTFTEPFKWITLNVVVTKSAP